MEGVATSRRIKQVRAAYNLTQREFSRRLALSDGYIGMIEANVTPPNARLIKLIVSEFGVSKTWLQTGEGEMFAAPEMDEKAARLVGLFNGLPPRYQEVVFGVIDLLRKAGE
jgi:transcriptional regulator with XRE-family HTH domain